MRSTSIRVKLTTYFLSIVVVMLTADIAFAFLHLSITERYEAIGANISNQYRLIDLTENLVANYNAYRNAPNARTLEAYEVGKENIGNLFRDLETTISHKESHATFVGVRNTIDSVMRETDAGVKDIGAGGIENTSQRYIEANKKLYYVKENTAALILKEVERSTELQREASVTSRRILALSAGLLVLVVLAAFLISNFLTKKLVSPLIRLKKLAQSIASGNLEAAADTDLLERKDEFGSLSQSLDIMIHNLRNNLHELQKSNNEMVYAKKAVEQKNADLERFNKLMIDRELKMMELKKRISELEAGRG